MPDPVEIKLTLDKSAVQRDLARMKEKVRQGQTQTAPGQLAPIQKQDSGRAAEVDRALEQERDARIRSGGGQSSFLGDLATAGPLAAGRRAILGAAEAGEFGAFAAGATKFAGGVAAAGGAVITAVMVAKAMAESAATITPIIVGIVNDWLKDEYPWLASTIGDDAEAFTAKIAGKVNEAIAAASTFISTVGETKDLELARARLGQRVDGAQIGSDFAKLQRIRADEDRIRRKQSDEQIERSVREIAKQLRRGAG